jgi:PhoH-like ATPase
LENRDFVIPFVVYKEIEKYRVDPGGRGYAARNVIRTLNGLRLDNKTINISKDGVTIPGTNNTLRVEVDHTSQDALKPDIRDESDNDKRILAVAKNLSQDLDNPVELITNDAPLTFIANVFEGVDAKEYDDGSSERFDGKIVIDTHDLGHGDDTVYDVDDEDILNYINDKYKRPPFNALIALQDGSSKNWLLKKGNKFEEFSDKLWPSAGPVYPKKDNIEQALAITYLKNPRLQMISLGGVAGAGKSLLAIAYGLDAVNKGLFSKVTVFRSMYAVGGQEQGFLKGDADEKMRPWAQAVWDNVRKYDKLLSKNRKKRSGPEAPAQSIEEKYEDRISVEPITYIRGRTFEDQLIIVDDAQSLDRSILLDIISRLGQNSKIIFTFDMDQQDNPYLSKGTSIVSLISRLKSEALFAHVDFSISERSQLAQLASKLLSELN